MKIKYKQIGEKFQIAIQVKLKASKTKSQSGFTIIESLMAIIVASILLAGIAPVIVLSVATRVQAKRVELGTQAARAYIDGVRAGVIPTPKRVVNINEVNGSKQFTSQRSTFAEVSAPSSTLPSCGTSVSGFPYCQNDANASLYCIDQDGGGCTNNSVRDLIIQVIRSTTNAASSSSTTSTDDSDKGYLLSVRVYRADAFRSGITLKKKAGDNAKQATFTGGLGNRQAPLAEMTTEIASKTTKFQDYCDRFGGCQ